ncbi:hypothetical protein DPMN_123025 [Dreissena polymorpha]|uniref:Uncharacterized protein n=1 Tax=Dreissena polymorpha TaxID=45954 RepID=A0A9D4GQT8_DREPO|nr:hypothetical protein DPMN_123025 [Dreissena polymorpha]
MFIDPSGPFANSSEIYIKPIFSPSFMMIGQKIKLPPPPGSHVIQLTGTIFQLNSRIKETNVLTKFHENWAKNKTSKKNALPTGGHVFSPIWTIFELVRHINKTNVLITFHYDWAKIKTALLTGGHLHEDWELNVTSKVFKLDRDFIGTKLLTKFHEDQPINVASSVFTNKC